MSAVTPPAPRKRFIAAELAGMIFRLRELGIFVALLVGIVIFSVKASNFLTSATGRTSAQTSPWWPSSRSARRWSC